MYMICQQYTTAIKEGYAGRPRSELKRQAAGAEKFREWLAALEINSQLRGPLVEQIEALEEGFRELMRE
jgi:hypothetical protein